MKLFQRLRLWLAAYGVWGHVQNLNEDARGKVKGSMFWHGRGWLHVPNLFSKERGERRPLFTFGLEWAWQKRIDSFGVSMRVHENKITFCFDLGFFTFYPSFEGFWFYAPNDRVTGMRWVNEFIWFDLWKDDDGWAKNWKGLHYSLNLARLFFGDLEYEEQQVDAQRTFIPMPEGAYPATVNLFRVRRGRQRWLKEIYIQARITPDKPVGIPGKGENAWDCDDDAIYEMSCQANTISQAVAKFVQSALRDREKYGWQNEFVQLAPAITNAANTPAAAAS